MMQTEIKDDGRNKVLEIRTERRDESFYELRMISQNQPAGLLRMRTEEEGEEQIFDYFISGLETLKDAEKSDNTDYLYSVIASLDRLSEVLYEYMLSPDKLLLSPETIFLKKETGKICFAYYPDKDTTFQESLQSLMEYYLKLLNPEDEREILLLYGLYRKSREKDVTLKTLAQYWNSFREEKEDVPGYRDEEERQEYTARRPDIRDSYREDDEKKAVSGMAYRENNAFREDTDYRERYREESPFQRSERENTGYGDRQDSGFKSRPKRSAEAFRSVLEDMNIQLPPGDEAFSRWKKASGRIQSGDRENDHRETEFKGQEIPVRENEKTGADSEQEKSKKRIELLLIILALIVIFYILTR